MLRIITHAHEMNKTKDFQICILVALAIYNSVQRIDRFPFVQMKNIIAIFETQKKKIRYYYRV